MKKFLLGMGALFALTGGSALAADLSPAPAPMYKAPAAIPPPVMNWSGFYIGGFVGGAAAGSATTSDPCLVGVACTTVGTYNGVPPLSYGLGSSFIGGGTVGGNWQIPGSQFVLGLEDELGYLHLRGSAVMNPPGIGNSDTTAKATIGDWYDAYTVRAGVAWNQLLVYGKVGGVFAGATTGVVDTTLPVTINTIASKTLARWAAGGGLEYAFMPSWSLKAEYLYLGLGSTLNQCAQVGGFPAGTIDCAYTKTPGVNTFKLGLNYRFN